MPSAITFKITDVGYTAALDADEAGLDLRIAEIAIGSGQYTPDGTETALVDEIQRWNVADGDVEPATNTLRFAAIMESLTRESAFEIGLFDEDGVLFAIASTVAVDPLLELYPNVANVGIFGLVLGDIPAGTITITLDPNAPLAMALIAQHLAAADPHNQYLTKVRATANGIDADLGYTNNFLGDTKTLLATGKYYVRSGSTNSAFGGLGEIITVDREDVLVVYQTSQCVNGQGKATRCLFNRAPTPTGWTEWDYTVTTYEAAKAATFVFDTDTHFANTDDRIDALEVQVDAIQDQLVVIEDTYPKLIASGSFHMDAGGVFVYNHASSGWSLTGSGGTYTVSGSETLDPAKHALNCTVYGISASGNGGFGHTTFDSGDMTITLAYAGAATHFAQGSWSIEQFAP